MILYLDTSSLVKVYVHEEGADEVRRLFASAALVVTSIIAHAEARAAFAQQRRSRALTPAAFEEAKRLFQLDWAAFVVMGLSDSLVQTAGELAEQHGLRALEGLHLASFQQFLERAHDDDVEFSSFDERLNRVARRLT